MTAFTELSMPLFVRLIQVSDESCITFQSWGELSRELGISRGELWRGVEPLLAGGALKHELGYALQLRGEENNPHRFSFTPTPEYLVLSEICNGSIGYHVDYEGVNETNWARWLDEHFGITDVLGVVAPFVDAGIVRLEHIGGKVSYRRFRPVAA